MTQTVTGVNDPQAVKRWGVGLAADVAAQSYMTRFTGKGANNPIEVKTELEKDAGDEIKFDLNMRFRKKPTYGDRPIEGNEEPLKFYQDTVKIDQVRKAGDAGGKMTRKRTLHDYRMQTKNNVATYMAEWSDEICFAYLSGTGPQDAINEDSLIMDDPDLQAGFAENPFQAPDEAHHMFAGAATAKNNIVAADTMSVNTIEQLSATVTMLNATNRDVINMRPITIDASTHFVLCMSPFDAYHMRTSAGDREWNAIQRAAAAAEGKNNPIFRGGLGMINNVVLHTHERVRRFNDLGVAGNLLGSRSILMGQQAAMIAHGETNTGRYTWVEKLKDYDNAVGIAAGSIMGIKKTRFNARDYGVYAVDSSSPLPKAA